MEPGSPRVGLVRVTTGPGVYRATGANLVNRPSGQFLPGSRVVRGWDRPWGLLLGGLRRLGLVLVGLHAAARPNWSGAAYQTPSPSSSLSTSAAVEGRWGCRVRAAPRRAPSPQGITAQPELPAADRPICCLGWLVRPCRPACITRRRVVGAAGAAASRYRRPADTVRTTREQPRQLRMGTRKPVARRLPTQGQVNPDGGWQESDFNGSSRRDAWSTFDQSTGTTGAHREFR